MSDSKKLDMISLLTEIVDELNRPQFGKWSEWCVEDYKRYYHENYAGMGRSGVRNDKAGKGSKFYGALSYYKILDEMIPIRKNDWTKYSIEDFKKHYEKNFAGMNATQLKKDDKNGGKEFYHAINSRKIQGKIITNSRVKWKGFEVEDFRQHYEENYAGMDRQEVRTSGAEGKSFYKVVHRKRLLDEIFPQNPNDYWKNYSDEEMLEHALENYEGMTRSDVNEDSEKINRLFFFEAQRRGILDMVLPLSYKAQGYWQDFENIKTELNIVIEEFGEVPTIGKLNVLHTVLSTSIIKYFGSYQKVLERMGHEHVKERRTNGYWTKENTLKEARKLYAKIGEIPGSREKLKELDLGSLSIAARKYFGGIRKLREKVSLEQEIRGSELALLEEIVEVMGSE